MTEPFLAEIRMFSFDFATPGFALCDGQILPINQNQSLYSLLGTTFGGDGETTFGLPDLRGRTPVHLSDDINWGQKSGQENHPLSEAEMPPHDHQMQASSLEGDAPVPQTHVLAATPALLYRDYDAGSATTLLPATIANAGIGQGHENMQPYLTINFCIALTGLFPSEN